VHNNLHGCITTFITSRHRFFWSQENRRQKQCRIQASSRRLSYGFFTFIVQSSFRSAFCTQRHKSLKQLRQCLYRFHRDYLMPPKRGGDKVVSNLSFVQRFAQQCCASGAQSRWCVLCIMKQKNRINKFGSHECKCRQNSIAQLLKGQKSG